MFAKINLGVHRFCYCGVGQLQSQAPVQVGLVFGVFEVNRPNRAARRRRGKFDPVDAGDAAHAVLSGDAGVTAKTRSGAGGSCERCLSPTALLQPTLLSTATSRAVPHHFDGKSLRAHAVSLGIEHANLATPGPLSVAVGYAPASVQVVSPCRLHDDTSAGVGSGRMSEST